MRRFHVGAVLALFVLAAAGRVRAGEPLDGKTFVGEAGEKGKTAGDKDEFSFADGKFHSKGCDPFGFGPASYTATTEGDVVTFEAVTTSEKEGEIHWIGTVVGDTLEGSFVWKKPAQDAIDYWFKGSLKKEG